MKTLMKTLQNTKTLGLTICLGFSLLASSGWAKSEHMVKTQREDFNALIQEGLESQKALRKELRIQAGQEEPKSLAAEVKQNGRVLVGTLDSEQVVSPTTNFVRQKLKTPALEDLQEKRVSSEFENLDH